MDPRVCCQRIAKTKRKMEMEKSEKAVKKKKKHL